MKYNQSKGGVICPEEMEQVREDRDPEPAADREAVSPAAVAAEWEEPVPVQDRQETVSVRPAEKK